MKNIPLVIFVFFIFLNSSACCQNIRPLSENEYNKIVKQEQIIQIGDQGVIQKVLDFGEEFPDLKPLDLLRFLSTKPHGFVSIMGSPSKDWISESDIAILINFVDSTQPASPVVSPLSSFVPVNKQSTVGIEAMCIISFYRGELYPPLCSNLYFCRPEEQEKMAEEFIKWWKDEIKNKII